MEAKRTESGKSPNVGARAISLASLVVVVVAALLTTTLLVSIPGARAYTPGAAEPDPALAGNVTFSNHTSGWGALTYSSQFGVIGNLSAITDPHVANPIQIVPTDVVAPGVLQTDKVVCGNGGLPQFWNYTGSGTCWTAVAGGAGQVATLGTAVVNGEPAVTETANSSHGAAEEALLHTNSIPYGSLPSTNPSFDWITLAYTVSTGATAGGDVIFALSNATTTTTPLYNAATGTICSMGHGTNTCASTASSTITPGGSYFLSASLAQLTGSTEGLNDSGVGATATVQVNIYLSMPKATGVSDVLTVTGFAITAAPISFGTTTWAKATVTRGLVNGTLNLTSLAPTISYSYIAGGGYTVSIAAQAAELSGSAVGLSESALSNGSEQVTYTFSFGLPTAPMLTYGAFKVTDVPQLVAWQYVSVNFAGTSYLSVYQTKANIGNYTTIVSTTSPTTTQAWVGTVVYTESQWISISSAPGLLTTAWFAFSFWWILGGFAGVLGLGTTVAFAGRKQAAERVR